MRGTDLTVVPTSRGLSTREMNNLDLDVGRVGRTPLLPQAVCQSYRYGAGKEQASLAPANRARS